MLATLSFCVNHPNCAVLDGGVCHRNEAKSLTERAHGRWCISHRVLEDRVGQRSLSTSTEGVVDQPTVRLGSKHTVHLPLGKGKVHREAFVIGLRGENSAIEVIVPFDEGSGSSDVVNRARVSLLNCSHSVGGEGRKRKCTVPHCSFLLFRLGPRALSNLRGVLAQASHHYDEQSRRCFTRCSGSNKGPFYVAWALG